MICRGIVMIDYPNVRKEWRCDHRVGEQDSRLVLENVFAIFSTELPNIVKSVHNTVHFEMRVWRSVANYAAQNLKGCET